MRNTRTGKGWFDGLTKVQRLSGSNGRKPASGAGSGGTEPPAMPPSEELQRFRRGEMTEEQYLEARITQATVHLRGRISNRKLERIRATVKRVCQSDPVLLAMKERVLRRPNKPSKG